MAVERTLSIIKPDAVGKNAIGQIISRFEEAGLQVVGAKMLHLSDAVAGGFYAEHSERPFYPDLVAFMTSGPVVVQVLEGRGGYCSQPRVNGRNQPPGSSGWHHPGRFCPIYRCQCRSRL